MSLEELLLRIQSTSDCKIQAPSGFPAINKRLRLPDDLHQFYQFCGGLTLGADTKYPIAIVPPIGCVQANPIFLGDVIGLAQQAQGDDISWSWYIIADCSNGDYLTIDFDQDRLGRCYDSFHETYGLVGEMRVIATSFTDLLTRLYENRGQYWYWLQSDFVSLGDAYEEVI